MIRRILIMSILALPLNNVKAQIQIAPKPLASEKKSIAFKGDGLHIDQKAFLSQHDVVFLSPATEGYEGFPIGNGDLGAMGWTPPDKLFFQINKTNTWDDAEPGIFSPWEDKENPEKAEQFTSLRHCGQLMIEPGLPVFDWMYLSDFEGRLSLADAEASWNASGPNGEVRCRSFVAKDPSVMVVRYEDNLSEPVDRRVTLARWGSRVFEHWYRFIRRDFLLGNEGTKAGCEGGEIWIEQPTRSLKFAMAAKLIGPDIEAQYLNKHEAGYVINTGKKCSFDIYLSVVTSEEADDPLAKARENVRKAAEKGTKNVFAAHKKQWADFWSKSFIDLPDDYLENLWYINLYQIGSSSLGEYPPHFIGGLWSWNRDARPWNHYYHWNQQTYTWPLHASGHPELMMPYVKWKREGLDKAIETAKIIHEVDGAFYSDVSDRRGNQGANTSEVRDNITATGLTAIDLWRHYQYTLDQEYLEKYAYPVLREVVRFYTNILEKDEDGRYYVPKALPNESPQNRLSSNTTNDLAAIRNLFPAFLSASGQLQKDEQLRIKAKQIVDNLAPYVFTKVPVDAVTWGPVKPGDTIIAYGTRLKTGLPGHPWSTRPYWLSNAPMDMPSSNHVVNAQLMPLFPANLISLDDEGTKLFSALRNAALSFDPIPNNGHGTNPICYARLGLKEYMRDILNRWVDEFQLFPQGFFCYFKRDYKEDYEQGRSDVRFSASEHKIRGLTNEVKVMSDKDEKVNMLRQPFAHMALEAGSILATTINEMLLQSHCGKIRVFPAVPDNWGSRFKLHAQGGFIVTSERAEGEVKYIAIESQAGQLCCVANPWNEGEKVRIRLAGNGNTILKETDSFDLTFKTTPGEIYIIERYDKPVSSFRQIMIGGTRNGDIKSKSRAQIGISRRF